MHAAKRFDSKHYKLLEKLEHQINQALIPHKLIEPINIRTIKNKDLHNLPEEEIVYNEDQDFALTALKQKLEKSKTKNKQLKQQIALLEQELEMKSMTLRRKEEEYENEVLAVKELKAQVQMALADCSDCKDCHKLTTEIAKLKSELKSKEAEAKELLRKKVKDDLAGLKYS
eukprot:TRINITY_DN6200_c0_g2_i1.p2 TRINITY_DN6200_c0_g2~~TRINITY_DN6200_c0_g2_i1.p2  ORF type:complete len:172 (+),score=40.38 TRINITY_DN6200_c0_g2_i1:83-598(+)